MEDGRVDTTVIESRQHKMGQMADFPPLLASSVFDWKIRNVPQIAFVTMRQGLMNLVKTTFFKKCVDP